jgi:hypothetical protein
MSIAIPRTLSTRTIRTRPGEPSCFAILPFLYQTKTITRHYSEHVNIEAKLGTGEKEEKVIHAIKEKWSVKKAGPRSRREDAPRTEKRMRPTQRRKKSEVIPFEAGTRDPAEKFHNTTMTPRELQIFEELFRAGIERKKTEDAHKVAKEGGRQMTEREFPDLLKPLAQEAELLRSQLASETMDAVKKTLPRKSIDQLEIKDKQSKRMKKLMDEATTDVALWEVLREEVLERLRDMPPDIASEHNFTALPGLILHYMSLMETKFPASSLGLVLMAELKRVGPSAFALGATTEMYNQRMRVLWRQCGDLNGVIDMLAEMDREVHAFDETTREIVASISDHVRAARTGKFGPGVQALWSMERRVRAASKLREWSRIVDERLEARTLREAQSRDVAVHDDDAGEDEQLKVKIDVD